MYQSQPHPVTVMTSFPSNMMPQQDIKSPSSTSYYFSTSSSNYAIAPPPPPMGWQDPTNFGSLIPSPESYSPPPIMTSSTYHSPSSSNVSFEEDDMPLFFSPSTAATHSPTDLSPTQPSSTSFSFLTSPPPTTTPHYHSSIDNTHHPQQQQHQQQQQNYQHPPLYYPKQPPVPLARPYACVTCPRAFARKHDLQRHIRVHTGAKPYLCVACKKPFARTDALKRHLRIEDACRLSPEIQALKGAGKRRYRNL